MDTNLYLHNTLTRKREAFRPRNVGNTVRMFTCGPSIYDFSHVGNFRTFLFEDVLERYLEYLGYRVERVINFTDVEDKAIAKAARTGKTLSEMTHAVEDRFFRDCQTLGIRLPETIPRSSTSVDQAVYLVEALLEKGYAYRHGMDIFYDPLKFKGFGRLYGLDMNRWPKRKIRFKKDTYPGKRWNLGDFILWKGRRKEDGDIYWKTSLGEGRPAWNIQDPAMVTKHLGYTVDIWCGGIDNLYRHHDYNIAVVEAVSGETLSNWWLHCEHVLAGDKKMSKSSGNILYVKDLLESGFSPHHLRFFLIAGHFRQRVKITPARMYESRGRIDTLRELASRLREAAPGDPKDGSMSGEPADRLMRAFENRMNDNLDVHGAVDAVTDTVQSVAAKETLRGMSREEKASALRALRKIDGVLNILGLT